jgi:hypothetical protein
MHSSILSRSIIDNRSPGAARRVRVMSFQSSEPSVAVVKNKPGQGTIQSVINPTIDGEPELDDHIRRYV